MRRKNIIIVFFITFIALILRFWGLGFGLPEGYHPDEGGVLFLTNSFWHGKFNVTSNIWALYGFHTYLIYFTQKSYVWITRFLGCSPLIENVFSFFYISPQSYLLGRAVSAILGSLTIPVVYLIGGSLFNHRVGIIASIFMAISYYHIVYSHYMAPEAAATFLVALSILFAVLIYKRQKMLYYLLAGLAAGLAAVTKHSTALVIIAVISAQFAIYFEKRVSRRFLVKGFGLFVAFLIFGFFIGCPHNFLDINSFLGRIRFEAGSHSFGKLTAHYGGWLEFLQKAHYGMGGTLLILGVCGVFSSIFWIARRLYKYLIIVSFPLIFFLFIGMGTKISARYILPIYPAVCVLAALFLVRMVNKIIGNGRKGLCVLVILVVLFSGGSIARDVQACYFFSHPDTRTLALQWINEHLPEGSRIRVERYCPHLEEGRYEIQKHHVPGRGSLNSYRRSEIDYIITSSLWYSRFYRDKRSEQMAFYDSLPRECRLVREFKLPEVYFSNPLIRIYSLRGEPRFKMACWPELLSLKHKEPSGIEFHFLSGSVMYQDGLSGFFVNGDVRKVIISQEKNCEIGVLVRNSSSSNRLRIISGSKRLALDLSPDESRYFSFKLSPGFPCRSYYHRIKFRCDDGKTCFVQLLKVPEVCGPVLLEYGEVEKAIEYLRQACKNFPDDWEFKCLLTVALSRAGKWEECINLAEELESTYEFWDLSAYEVKFLEEISGKEFEAESLPRRTGNREFDVDASGAEFVSYDPEEHKPECLVYGPYEKFPAGSYVVVFRLRRRGEWDSGGKVKLDVAADVGTKVLAKRYLTDVDFNKDGWEDFYLNFSHGRIEHSLEFRVDVEGKAGIDVDKIAVYPDILGYVAMTKRDYCIALARAYNAMGRKDKAESYLRDADKLPVSD